MLAHISSFGRNPRGSPDFLAYPVPKACMPVLGTGVPRRLGVARSASSPRAAQALGCSLTPGLRISFGRVTCMARAASVPGLWTLGLLLLCGACAWVWVVLGLGFRLRPATPGSGIGVLCVCLRAPLVPRHSWLGRAVWVLGFWLRPATPSWGVGACVCLCARSACTPPLLAGVCGVHVCVRARLWAAPRHSWLGCWGVCVLVCAPRLYPATPGWVVRCGCVCLGSGFGCAPPLLAGVLGCVFVCVRSPLVPRHSWLWCAMWVCVLGLGLRLRPATPCWGVGVCVFACALRLYPATPGLAVLRWCVCLGLGVGCAPPFLAGVLGCVGLCARSVLVPRLSWLGCAVCVCVLVLGFRLRSPSPGCGVGVCMCLCARSACTPPLLAGVLGCVCACVCVPLVPATEAVPRTSWLG